MEIQLAVPGDFRKVRRYDSHIPSPRLADCIENNRVYVLRDGGNIVGVLRYSLFWQTIPFLDLLFLDEAYRGRGAWPEPDGPLGSGDGKGGLFLRHALHPGG